MIEIELLGTNFILPAFAVGYEVESISKNARSLPKDGPIMGLFQQAGGYGMQYTLVIGGLLRLDANQDRGIKPLGNLISGFRAMAEDPDFKTLADYPALGKCVGTHGNEYSSSDLELLESFVTSYVAIPRMVGGIEAFIRFEECNPLQYFKNWSVFSCIRKPGISEEKMIFEEGLQSELECKDSYVFDESMIERIREVGSKIDRISELRLFFMWENSD